MKLIVKSGSEEVGHREIELIGVVKVQDNTENPERTLNVISCNGMDHYFTKDGLYDGWGSGCPSVIEQFVQENPPTENPIN